MLHLYQVLFMPGSSMLYLQVPGTFYAWPIDALFVPRTFHAGINRCFNCTTVLFMPESLDAVFVPAYF